MERIDELQRGGLVLIQDSEKFCFGTDAVLLADFAKAKPGEKVMDLCAGSGVVSTLMYARMNHASYQALELQKELADMGKRSIVLNHLSDRLCMHQGDLKQIKDQFAPQSFDVVTVNPPYMEGQGLINESEALRLARHEIACTLADVVEAASYLLKYHGRFYMVHRPTRLSAIFEACLKAHLEPKSMQLVYPFADKAPTQVLLGCTKYGGREMKVLPPLVTYERPGVYTKEMLEVYGQDGHHLPL